MRQTPPNPLYQGGTKPTHQPTNPPTHLYAFTLGREWKLSLAELFAVFGGDAYQTHSETVAIFQIVGFSDEQIQKRFMSIGGSIRVIKIIGTSSEKTFPTDVIECLRKAPGKGDFALGAYGLEFRLSDIGLRIKKTLGESGKSVRLVNQKNENINAASFKKEKLAKTGLEFNLVSVGEKTYIGQSLACQDIDAYAARDIGKSRDMIVGMMPPKLVQMMINLAIVGQNITKSKNPIHIYDPFCGLGTTLIEAANMGIKHVFGSDISRDMVTASVKSLDEFIRVERMWQERIKLAGGVPNKDFTHFESKIFELDASNIDRSFEKYGISATTLIVSEGYLGEIMSPRDISLEKVQSERKKLAGIYTKFFTGLRDADFRGSIVMTFPFWNIHGTYSYFTEIYDIIEKSGFSVESLLPWEMKLNTSKGSLLYRRENQTVGREVVRIIQK